MISQRLTINSLSKRNIIALQLHQFKTHNQARMKAEKMNQRIPIMKVEIPQKQKINNLLTINNQGTTIGLNILQSQTMSAQCSEEGNTQAMGIIHQPSQGKGQPLVTGNTCLPSQPQGNTIAGPLAKVTLEQLQATPTQIRLGKTQFLVAVKKNPPKTAPTPTETKLTSSKIGDSEDDANKVALVPAVPNEFLGNEVVLRTFQELADKWKKRSKVRRQLTSLFYQKMQARFLYVAICPELFEEHRDQSQWSYTTTQMYYTAAIAAMQAAEQEVPQKMKLQAKLLSILAKEEDPKRPTVAASPEEVQKVVKRLSKEGALALQVSFTLGQRVGDVFKLSKSNISSIQDERTKKILTCLTFKKGKTIKRTQPYTVHLDGELGKSLLEHATSVKTSTTLLFQFQELLNIKTTLRQANQQLCLLSIRRGGLQHMAQRGASQETLLHHSRHTTQETLMRYLDWGIVNLQHVRELQNLPSITSSEPQTQS